MAKPKDPLKGLSPFQRALASSTPEQLKAWKQAQKNYAKIVALEAQNWQMRQQLLAFDVNTAPLPLSAPAKRRPRRRNVRRLGRPRWTAPATSAEKIWSSELGPERSVIEYYVRRFKNAELSRNQDGSHNCILSFGGLDAWEKAREAAEDCPSPAWVSFRYLINEAYRADSQLIRGTKVRLWDPRLGKWVDYIMQSTPVYPIARWPEAYNYVFITGIGESDEYTLSGVRRDDACLAIFWPTRRERASKKQENVMVSDRAREKPTKKPKKKKAK